jgi:hypothetical protein
MHYACIQVHGSVRRYAVGFMTDSSKSSCPPVGSDISRTLSVSLHVVLIYDAYISRNLFVGPDCSYRLYVLLEIYFLRKYGVSSLPLVKVRGRVCWEVCVCTGNLSALVCLLVASRETDTPNPKGIYDRFLCRRGWDFVCWSISNAHTFTISEWEDKGKGETQLVSPEVCHISQSGGIGRVLWEVLYPFASNIRDNFTQTNIHRNFTSISRMRGTLRFYIVRKLLSLNLCNIFLFPSVKRQCNKDCSTVQQRLFILDTLQGRRWTRSELCRFRLRRTNQETVVSETISFLRCRPSDCYNKVTWQTFCYRMGKQAMRENPQSWLRNLQRQMSILAAVWIIIWPVVLLAVLASRHHWLCNCEPKRMLVEPDSWPSAQETLVGIINRAKEL